MPQMTNVNKIFKMRSNGARDFNTGRCTFQGHHQGKYAGQVTKLWNICRVCWFKLRQKKFDRAGSELYIFILWRTRRIIYAVRDDTQRWPLCQNVTLSGKLFEGEKAGVQPAFLSFRIVKCRQMTRQVLLDLCTELHIFKKHVYLVDGSSWSTEKSKEKGCFLVRVLPVNTAGGDNKECRRRYCICSYPI